MKRISPTRLFLALVGLGLLKLWYLHGQLGLRLSPTWLIGSAAVLGAVFLPVLYLRPQLRRPVAMVLNLLVSLLLLADVVYSRNLHILIPAEAFQMVGQVGAVTADVQSSISPLDLALLADSVLLIIALRLLPEGQALLPQPRALLGVLVSILAITTLGSTVITAHNSRALAVARFGALSYHLSDWFFGPGELQVDDLALAEYRRQQAMARRGQLDVLNGAAAGRNLIVIQLESFQNLAINRQLGNQEITPFLNRLIQQDTIYFDRFYQTLGLGRTSDAEFSSLTSLYPSEQQASFQEYQGSSLYALPQILRDLGYQTAAFHGYEPAFWNREQIYPELGFERFYSQGDFSQQSPIGMGTSDKELLQQTVAYLGQTAQPFLAWTVTLSGHHPFYISEQAMTERLDTKVYEKSGSRDTRIFGHYWQALRYADAALELFFRELQTAGLYDQSLIVIYGDHYGIPRSNAEQAELMSELLGHEYGNLDMLNVPLLIHLPGLGSAETLQTTGGHIDLLPTLLNLLGIQSDPRAMIMGQDLINTDHGFVALHTYLPKGSFIDDQRIFQMAADGVFAHSSAWDISSGEPVNLEACRAGYERSLREIEYSHFVLEYDQVFAPAGD